MQMSTGVMSSDVVRCPMDVADFPFDTQTCSLDYTSQSTVVVRLNSMQYLCTIKICENSTF
jgi:hypothetical protein